ncbi:MAG: DNA gyrase subunit A, partial [Candidatus Roizmanbacteria bacterium]
MAEVEELDPQDEYQKLADREHVLLRPDTFVGSTDEEVKNMSIVDFGEDDNATIVEKEIIYIQGLERCVLELISNAADNARKSRVFGIDAGKIKIHVENDHLSVYNEGRPISCQWHRQHKQWIPEMIFTNCKAGSNFNDDEERKWAGRNGLGAKLAGILSNRFEIDIHNTTEGKIYRQSHESNMGKINKAEITDMTKRDMNNPSHTMITWYPDFKFFYCRTGAEADHKVRYEDTFDNEGQLIKTKVAAAPRNIDPCHCKECWDAMQGQQEHGIFKQDFIALVARIALDFAFNCKVVIEFTSSLRGFEHVAIFDVQKAIAFAYFYMPALQQVEAKPIVYESPDGDIRMVAFDTPYNGKAISFANGMPTREGGVHVNAWLNAIGEKLKKEIYGKKKIKITAANLKKHITIFLSVYVDKPAFTTQTKEKLTRPTPSTYISAKQYVEISSWEASKALLESAQQKEKNRLKAGESRSERYVPIDGTDDAHNAGPKTGHQCTAYIVEGGSAKTFWVKGLKHMQGGRQYNGCFALRGKFLNITKADVEKQEKNKVLNNLKMFTGLRTGVDYSRPVNRNKLRYGKVKILVDADVDGIHIKTLLYNFFASFDNLLESGYVEVHLTPVISVTKGRNKVYLYDMGEFERWKKKTPDHAKWEVAYFKGLGTATDEINTMAFENPVDQIITIEEGDAAILNMVFGESTSDDRKDLYTLLINSDPASRMSSQNVTSLKNMIFDELMLFAVIANRRGIPAMTDGFKDAIRRIVYTAITQPSKKLEKLTDFSSTVSKLTKYHHGQEALQGTVIGLGADFPGANNIPLFEKQGEFGSRIGSEKKGPGGDAAAARYLHIRPSEVLRLIIRPEDDDLLQKEYEDGKEICVINFEPILPPWAYNSGSGMGWGWSTTLWQYNPKQLIEWVSVFIQHVKDGKPSRVFKPPKLIPWWRGYEGQVFRQRDNRLVNRGYFHQDGDTVYITELPLMTAGDKYAKAIKDKLIAEKELFTSFDKDGLYPNKPQYILYGATKPCYRHNELKLEYKMSETNMVLLDEDNLPKCYFYGVVEMMAVWCRRRYLKYVERKKSHTEKLEEQLRIATLRLDFVEDVIAVPPRLELRNVEKSIIQAYMNSKNYPLVFLDMSLR